MFYRGYVDQAVDRSFMSQSIYVNVDRVGSASLVGSALLTRIDSGRDFVIPSIPEWWNGLEARFIMGAVPSVAY